MVAVCEISAGTYPIGDDQRAISRPAHTVNLPAFAIATTTVTNVEFLNFIAAGGYQVVKYWGTEMARCGALLMRYSET